jgi:hypothetical protein
MDRYIERYFAIVEYEYVLVVNVTLYLDTHSGILSFSDQIIFSFLSPQQW